MYVIYAQYFQGGGGGVLGFGPVAVGMVFTPRSNGKFKGVAPFGVIGTPYSVTGLIPDPTGNPNVVAEYPGDQITLTGAVDATWWPNATATVSSDWLENAYRIS